MNTPYIRPTIYEARKRALPPLGRYFSEVWAKRRLVWALAQAAVKAGHLDTWFGRLWTILNPLLLGLTYFLLIGIILGKDVTFAYLARLLGGLFAFYFTRSSVGSGANSIVKGGAMVRATAVPRMILPLSSVAIALRSYFPTLLAYSVFHIFGGLPITSALIMVPVVILIHTVMNVGLALLFATATVFFRDTSSFLPYFLRIWMYVTPVLYLYSELPVRIRPYLELNPLYRLFAAWQQIIFGGTFPSAINMGLAVAWSVAVLILGIYVFLAKEREFAIRI